MLRINFMVAPAPCKASIISNFSAWEGGESGGRDHFSKDDVVFIDHFQKDDIERFGRTDNQKIAIFGRCSLWMLPYRT